MSFFIIFSATEESCSIKRATSLPGQDTYLERVSRAPNKTPHIHRNGQSRAAETLCFCCSQKPEHKRSITSMLHHAINRSKVCSRHGMLSRTTESWFRALSAALAMETIACLVSVQTNLNHSHDVIYSCCMIHPGTNS